MNKLNYESYWDNYSTHSSHPSVRLRNRFILNQLKKIKFDSSVDVGCGDGYLINIVQHHFPGKRLSGLDLSGKIIELNSSKYKDIYFHKMDISTVALDFPDKYDVVICSEVIEHLKDWKTALMNLSKLINKDGFLILTTQSGKRYKSDIENGHLQHFELNVLEEELSKVNLKTIRSYKKGYPFYNMQKWLYEKNENTAKDFHTGLKGKSFLGKALFSLTFYLFLLTPGLKKLGPQIFIVARKD